MDKQTNFLDGQTFGKTVSKKFLKDCFEQVFGHILATFGNFGANFEQNRVSITFFCADG